MAKLWYVTLSCLSALLPLAFGQAIADQYPTLRIDGLEQLVVSADTMNCASRPQKEFDVPDMPPTAFRWPDGTVSMIASNRQNLRLDGPSLDEVRRVGCRQLLQSAGDDNPANFRDQEWIAALYSKTPGVILGFVHNEYHGEFRDNGECKTTPEKDRECWYASSTLVISTDGGETFTRPQPPANVIISLPYAYVADQKRAGVFLPKVVGGHDGMTYVFASYVDRNRDNKIGQCLARGDAEVGGTWKIWDGKSFADTDPSPYGCAGQCVGRTIECTPVIPDNIFSVKYIPSKHLYVAVGVRGSDVLYRFSADLISWSQPENLLSTTVMPRWKEGDPPPDWYFSLLDPGSSSQNFDTLESTPFLYFVRFRIDHGKLDRSRRDILRFPIAIQ